MVPVSKGLLGFGHWPDLRRRIFFLITSTRFTEFMIIGSVSPIYRFFKKLATGGSLLLVTTVTALLWANISPQGYAHFWHTTISLHFGPLSFSKSLLHWIDEALMTLFFFLVGLEIKREFLIGELSTIKKALLPVAAAVGGMILPALCFALFNYNTETAGGWGIPMATDIAFALAVLAVIRSRVPFGVKIFLSALAIADDLGAVLVIAVFYTSTIHWGYIGVILLLVGLLAIANMLWIRYALVYALIGLFIWGGFLSAGIHATVAGVIVALFVPARGRYDTDTFIKQVHYSMDKFGCEEGSCGRSIMLDQNHLNAVRIIEVACHNTMTPLQRFENSLNPWVSILIIPLFALANAGVSVEMAELSFSFTHPLTLGIIAGLVIGKPCGIFLFTYMTSRLMNIPLTGGTTWSHIAGASLLGGIGFTMSIFISGLSFTDPQYISYAKIGILTGSVIAALSGITVLLFSGLQNNA